MFDVHSHLLPGIDDGARNLSESTENIRLLKKSGFEGVAFTPHFYPKGETPKDFAEKRNAIYEKMKSMLTEEGISSTIGAEIYLSSSLFNADDISPLCFSGTRTALIEPEDAEKFTTEIERKFIKLVNDYQITPVVAHAERFPYIISDTKVMEYLRDMGCLFQINLYSLSSFFLKRKIVRAIEKGFVDFFGNDLHSAPLDVNGTGNALSFLKSEFGKELFTKIGSNVEEYILTNGLPQGISR